MKTSGPNHWRAASAYKPKMYGWVYQHHLWRITERAGTPSGKGSSVTQRSLNIRSREAWSKSWEKRKGHSHKDNCISSTESFFPGAASWKFFHLRYLFKGMARCCFFFFYILFIFNWKIITLQYCVGLYHTLTGAGHRYTYVPSLFNLPPTSHPIKGWLGFWHIFC